MAENRDGNEKVYAFESLIYQAGDTGGAYVIFPYNVREEFGRWRDPPPSGLLSSPRTPPWYLRGGVCTWG